MIHKSLRDFRPLRYSSWDGHAEGEHVNRGTDTPIFCPTLLDLDMSTLAPSQLTCFGKLQDTTFSYSLSTPCFVMTAPSGEICKYATGPSIQKSLERFSTYWYAPFCCVCLGCCATELGSSEGTYELPCIYINDIATGQLWVRKDTKEICHTPFQALCMLLHIYTVENKGKPPENLTLFSKLFAGRWFWWVKLE